MPKWKTGTIAGVSGYPTSGMYMLHFQHGVVVPIESGYGMRQLHGAAEAMGLDGIRGMRIRYRLDDMGLGIMGAFSPIGSRRR